MTSSPSVIARITQHGMTGCIAGPSVLGRMIVGCTSSLRTRFDPSFERRPPGGSLALPLWMRIGSAQPTCPRRGCLGPASACRSMRPRPSRWPQSRPGLKVDHRRTVGQRPDELAAVPAVPGGSPIASRRGSWHGQLDLSDRPAVNRAGGRVDHSEAPSPRAFSSPRRRHLRAISVSASSVSRPARFSLPRRRRTRSANGCRDGR
jgi:hypothetical protein